ncbi:MAG TPA: type II CAAX endopeptidase family protein [Anaerolineae bacterium]|nr:type II CAAX endopeptidase family protein [Anaerolineae bacterium]
MNFTRLTESSRPNNLMSAIGLAVAFIAYYLASILSWFGIAFDSGGPAMSIFWKVIAAVIIIGFMRLFEKRPLASVNITLPSEKDITWAFYLWGLSMAWYWLISTILPPEQSEGVNTIANLHPLVVIGIILTAATVEELFYRGYLIERLHQLTGRLWIGVIVSCVIFTVPHVQFFGPSWLIYHGVNAILLYVLYLWRRNLVAVMVLHLLGNLPILIPTFMAYFSR